MRCSYGFHRLGKRTRDSSRLQCPVTLEGSQISACVWARSRIVASCTAAPWPSVPVRLDPFATMSTPPPQAAFEVVHVESEEEAKNSSSNARPAWMKKAAFVLAVGLGVVGFMALPKARRFCQGLDLDAFQGKSNLDLDTQMALKADALKSVRKHSAAQKIVLKAMKSTGRKYSKHFQQREVRALPADPADAAREMLTKDSDSEWQEMQKAGRAFLSVVGMGDDINAIIRSSFLHIGAWSGLCVTRSGFAIYPPRCDEHRAAVAVAGAGGERSHSGDLGG
eukprot:s7018_g2.t1